MCGKKMRMYISQKANITHTHVFKKLQNFKNTEAGE